MKIKNKDQRKISDIIDSTLIYKKFKYQGVIYSIGQNVVVNNSDNESNTSNNNNNGTESQIVNITNIIPSNGIAEYPLWPCIEVHRYYSKAEIKLSIEERNAISENELFLSDQAIRILIETVIRKVTVHTLEEYTQLAEIEEDTYYTRALYSPLSNEIKPQMTQWERYCFCNTPFNPDLLYICCDKCGKWFHSNCFGLTQSVSKVLSKFYCFECS